MNNAKRNGPPVMPISKDKLKDRLSVEEYTELLHSDHYSIPCDFHEEEYEEGKFDYVPGGYNKIFYRTLAVKDPEFHDWVICTVSRIYWLRYMHMAMYCQENGFDLLLMSNPISFDYLIISALILSKSKQHPRTSILNSCAIQLIPRSLMKSDYQSHR